MKFADKKLAYQQMQSVDHVDADRALLQVKSPQAHALATGILDKAKEQREILWSLLDVATVEEIKENRNAGKTGIGAKDFFELQKLVSLEKIPETVDEIVVLDDQINTLIETLGEDNLPDEFKETIAAQKGHMLEVLNKIQKDEEAAYLAKVHKSLLKLNLVKAEQKTLARFARDINLKTPDYKAVTLRTLLDEYRLNLPKEGPATGKTLDGIPSDINKVNELNAEKKSQQGAAKQ